MLRQYVISTKATARVTVTCTRRYLATHDGRNRLSNFWTPVQASRASDGEASHNLLVQYGFLRQAHSGIFHLLPLGLRVQEKLEGLIDKHMRGLGASKVALSSLSSEELWARSGRLEGRDSEFFRLQDRRGARFLLSPTHEEEITSIVANAVHSHKNLPLRLYQITRKYRDEARPRQGLLRGREFLMKDLYTFDATEEAAISTYESVRAAYCAFLDELKMPYLVANADSGKMGGNLSHEYHFKSNTGEDEIINCKSCGFAINAELYVGEHTPGTHTALKSKTVFGISRDREQMIKLVLPENAEINYYAVKKILPQLDTSVEDPLATLEEAGAVSNVVTLVDPRCDGEPHAMLDDKLVHLTKAQHGDQCPKCAGSLDVDRAVEIGHTFHLATRYSAALGAVVTNAQNQRVPVQMGCHGIGMSRLIAVMASLLKDDKGLNWPLAAAPFQAVLIDVRKSDTADVDLIYDSIPLDTVIDDRKLSVGQKLAISDAVGYPFLIVVGNKWVSERKLELQCRRLDIKEFVHIEMLASRISGLRKDL